MMCLEESLLEQYQTETQGIPVKRISEIMNAFLHGQTCPDIARELKEKLTLVRIVVSYACAANVDLYAKHARERGLK